jgi:hypothetical protein
MKTLLRIVSAVFVLLPLSCLAADLTTLVIPAGVGLRYSEAIVLEPGDSARVEFNGVNSPAGKPTLEIQIGALVFDLSAWNPSSDVEVPVLAGPATIRAKRNGTDGGISITTIAITRANSAANVIPANAVVIPEDASGQYQVILESSTDLITWAAANPGTYGGTTQKRFFRTRIVKVAP